MLRDIRDEMRDSCECFLERFLADRFCEVSHGAGLESLLSALDSADDVNRDMACMRISLQALENLDSIHTGHVDVERDRVGTVFLRRRKTAVTIEGNDSLEFFFARHSEQHLREAHVVLDDEHRPVARLDCLVIVFDDILSRAPIRLYGRNSTRRCRPPGWIRIGARRGRSVWPGGGGCKPSAGRIRFRRARAVRIRIGVAHRKEERERAALVRHAFDTNLAPDEPRYLPADRKSKAGSPEPAGGGAIGLLECLENHSLLVLRDSDAGVRHRESDDYRTVVE